MLPRRLECSRCGLGHDAGTLQGSCESCAAPLFARYDLDAAARTLRRGDLAGRRRDLWRYAEVLPIAAEREIVGLGEGMTPCLPAGRLGAWAGAPGLLVKDEGANPTGSFKARGMAVAVTAAKRLGARALFVPSAGNAGVALAAYAARAGLPALVALPLDAPAAMTSDCRACGAEILAVEGTIREAAAAGRARAGAIGAFDLSTLREPYRVEGKKTMAYELAEQLERLPDWIVYPCGGGTGVVGMWKAFEEMEALGWTDGRRPKLLVVQSERCAPVVRAFEEGKEETEPFPEPETCASGLRVPAPPAGFLLLRALRESGGAALAVSEAEILEGIRAFARLEGIVPSPEGAAALAGLRRATRAGLVREGEAAVLFQTGSGAKYGEVIARALP